MKHSILFTLAALAIVTDAASVPAHIRKRSVRSSSKTEKSKRSSRSKKSSRTSSSSSRKRDKRQDSNIQAFSRFPFMGVCDDSNSAGKNVILVIGDGMGWESTRAGSIAKQVIEELEGYGCTVQTGCLDNHVAMEAFNGRSLKDYYTKGKGCGLPWQNLDGYILATSSGVIPQGPKAGEYEMPKKGLLAGDTSTHATGMSPLALDAAGYPIDFSPLDYESQGGHMVLWNDTKGGACPWDERYYQNKSDPLFDPEYIMRHTPCSGATATSFASGHKTASGMLSVNLYEQEVPTLIEDAMRCRKAAGIVTSVSVLHATPAAFITHSNNRNIRDRMQRSFMKVNPTLASGVCYSRFYPSPKDIESMKSGILSKQWTFLHQQDGVLAENFYAEIQDLSPDNGDHLLVCLGGDFSPSKRENLPFRGVDGNYRDRWCSSGRILQNWTTGKPVKIGVKPTTKLCNHYEAEEISQIPHISTNVAEALKFLGKAKNGFFLLVEQGDIDIASHKNHMDDMLGAILDLSDTVQVILDWVEDNGGWDKNALYVTADHDHYLTLKNNFPEALANFLIAGESYNITPKNNSGVNAWFTAISAGRHLDNSKSKTEHIRDFSTWSEEDIQSVGHYWGPPGSGGNGWSWHTTRPVPLSYAGDNHCIEALTGAGFQVNGRQVAGSEGKIDQVHLHACMARNLFGL